MPLTLSFHPTPAIGAPHGTFSSIDELDNYKIFEAKRIQQELQDYWYARLADRAEKAETLALKRQSVYKKWKQLVNALPQSGEPA